MDVPPPWYTVTGETCSGETRSCGGGDEACRAQAARDGYVARSGSNYAFCKRDETHTVPTAGGAILPSALSLGAIVVRLGAARVERAHRVDPSSDHLGRWRRRFGVAAFPAAASAR